MKFGANLKRITGELEDNDSPYLARPSATELVSLNTWFQVM